LIHRQKRDHAAGGVPAKLSPDDFDRGRVYEANPLRAPGNLLLEGRLARGTAAPGWNFYTDGDGGWSRRRLSARFHSSEQQTAENRGGLRQAS
jgi:hypothetical protein